MSDLREKPYSTSDVMKAFSLGRNTLRLYEEMGLLVGMTRTDSGYRRFKAQQIEDLRFILEAKKVGFTLNEIKDLLDVTRAKDKMTCGTVSSEIAQKIEQLDEQMRSLAAKKVFLTDFNQACRSNDKDAECNVMSAGFSSKACCD